MSEPQEWDVQSSWLPQTNKTPFLEPLQEQATVLCNFTAASAPTFHASQSGFCSCQRFSRFTYTAHGQENKKCAMLHFLFSPLLLVTQ